MEIKSTTIEAKRVAAHLQLMAGQLDRLASHILAEAKKSKKIKKKKKKKEKNKRKLIHQHALFVNLMYKVLISRNGHSQTCSDMNNINKHISLILYDLFLFHVIHTYASILRFPTLHYSLWEIYHSVLDLYRYPISRHLLHHTQQAFLTIIHRNESSPSTKLKVASLSRKHLFLTEPVR